MLIKQLPTRQSILPLNDFKRDQAPAARCGDIRIGNGVSAPVRRSARTNARMVFRLAFLAAWLMGAPFHADKAWSDVVIRIDLSQQTMSVDVDSVHYATWAVSTARPGYRTPVGSYKPYLMDRMHYSKLYDYTPMPYSIFFLRGYAIHGTTEVRNLGRPVSHGCVRLRPDNARALFGLVGKYGLQNTIIAVVD